MEVRNIPINQLKPSPYNPRIDLQSEDPEYQKLKRSIEEFGYVDLLVWNERTGNVVGGHQRLKILKELGYTEIDVSVVNVDDKTEKAMNIALNKIEGDWDNEKLKDLLEELDTGEIDIEITGFDFSELEDLMTQFYVDDEDEKAPEDFDEIDEVETEYKCPKCHYEWSGSPK